MSNGNIGQILLSVATGAALGFVIGFKCGCALWRPVADAGLKALREMVARSKP